MSEPGTFSAKVGLADWYKRHQEAERREAIERTMCQCPRPLLAGVYGGRRACRRCGKLTRKGGSQ